MLLATTALVAASMVALPDGACAAEVNPGGALDLTITGFARFETFGGEQDDLALDQNRARGLDFRNDTEVHVVARGKDEQTGLEYGATIEFEADTNNTANTDETWIFLRGGWGEVRLGDEDGAYGNQQRPVHRQQGRRPGHGRRELVGVGIEASAVGLYGELKNDGKEDFGGDDWWGVQGGAAINLSGFNIAGSIGSDNVGDTERNFFTAGVGYDFGDFDTSITYGQIFDANADFEEATGIGDSAYNLVFSADYRLVRGLVLAGDVAVFDNDQTDAADSGTGDKGLGRGGPARRLVLVSAELVVQAPPAAPSGAAG